MLSSPYARAASLPPSLPTFQGHCRPTDRPTRQLPYPPHPRRRKKAWERKGPSSLRVHSLLSSYCGSDGGGIVVRGLVKPTSLSFPRSPSLSPRARSKGLSAPFLLPLDFRRLAFFFLSPPPLHLPSSRFDDLLEPLVASAYSRRRHGVALTEGGGGAGASCVRGFGPPTAMGERALACTRIPVLPSRALASRVCGVIQQGEALFPQLQTLNVATENSGRPIWRRGGVCVSIIGLSQ